LSQKNIIANQQLNSYLGQFKNLELILFRNTMYISHNVRSDYLTVLQKWYKEISTTSSRGGSHTTQDNTDST